MFFDSNHLYICKTKTMVEHVWPVYDTRQSHLPSFEPYARMIDRAIRSTSKRSKKARLLAYKICMSVKSELKKSLRRLYFAIAQQRVGTIECMLNTEILNPNLFRVENVRIVNGHQLHATIEFANYDYDTRRPCFVYYSTEERALRIIFKPIIVYDQEFWYRYIDLYGMMRDKNFYHPQIDRFVHDSNSSVFTSWPPISRYETGSIDDRSFESIMFTAHQRRPKDRMPACRGVVKKFKVLNGQCKNFSYKYQRNFIIKL
ncbi:hypothetical protein SlsnVgp130 [Spodoptera littoralis nucleopolyhedrovirus]|uniref:Uncharacterized protein n=1 Tax=Spodoptera littoralis nuclear polyhedrosis virus TaxID=10456 RepID=M1JTK6_NPVSL|nr:hypothetical protein SlsnVgp130 [Spodoptera littoralis nucleopolyhedrovirus]AGE89985.1 hypothetical protein SlsnVgp130 [Spodoptera littoralis nucleopolyhedrovirus]AYU75317.1 hypothetical protein [Spodoptera littoralis nucleopolyhedrovirus]